MTTDGAVRGDDVCCWVLGFFPGEQIERKKKERNAERLKIQEPKEPAGEKNKGKTTLVNQAQILEGKTLCATRL